MAVYDVFKALGLHIHVRAILDTNHDSAFLDYFEDYEERYYAEKCRYDRFGLPIRHGEVYKPPRMQTHAVVGDLGRMRIVEAGGNGEGIEELVEAWWGGSYMKLIWVNKPRHSDLDMAHVTASTSLHTKMYRK
jgi:hypothetical protein